MAILFLLLIGGIGAAVALAIFVAAMRAKNASDFVGIFLLVLVSVCAVLYALFRMVFGDIGGMNM
jgi:hypothetical protein